jgi:(E)-4-hydroxy-3-methylbut-2-enyl-diphosphate synthase
MRSPYSYHRRQTHAVAVIGNDNVPRVVADLRAEPITRMEDLSVIGHSYDPGTDKWSTSDQAAEFLYMGLAPLPFMAPAGTRQLLDVATWLEHDDHFYCVPVFSIAQFRSIAMRHTVMNVVHCTTDELSIDILHELAADASVVLMLGTTSPTYFTAMRECADLLLAAHVHMPVILAYNALTPTIDDAILDASTDVGGLLVEGFGDAVMITLTSGAGLDTATSIRTAFGILQAARTRMTKTEYISCPSCGRTLFDLQETTAMIRSHTDHLKGVKIGIMGCIVNGPGEMADADYGYVGSGPDRITLYRGQEIVQRNIPSAGAVDALIDIIRNDGRWVEK